MLGRSSRAMGIASLAALSLMLGACSGAPVTSTSPTTAAQPTSIATTAPTTVAAPSVAATSSVAALIPEGTYLSAPIDAARVRAQLDTDKTLTEAQKAELISGFLAGHTTVQTKLEFGGGTFTESMGGVGGPFEVGLRATYAFPGDGTLLIQEACCGTSSFDVVPTSTGFGLKVRPNSAANAGTDVWIGRLVFESAPYTKAP